MVLEVDASLGGVGILIGRETDVSERKFGIGGDCLAAIIIPNGER